MLTRLNWHKLATDRQAQFFLISPVSRLNSHQLEQSRGELRFESRPVDFVWFPYDLRIGTIADKNSAN